MQLEARELAEGNHVLESTRLGSVSFFATMSRCNGAEDCADSVSVRIVLLFHVAGYGCQMPLLPQTPGLLYFPTSFPFIQANLKTS